MTKTQTKNPRTTSREVKAKIQSYVIDCISTDGFPVKDDTLKTSLELVCAEFNSAACYRYNLLRLKTYQEIFIDWLDGLPSCFSIECYNGATLELMASFGLPLPSNKEPEDGIKLFKYLIFREFVALCKKNNINFWAYCNTKD